MRRTLAAFLVVLVSVFALSISALCIYDMAAERNEEISRIKADIVRENVTENNQVYLHRQSVQEAQEMNEKAKGEED